MKANPYQLIAADIDGTLLNSKHELSARTAKVLRATTQLGIHFVLATGKQYAAIRELVDAFGLRSPQITADGAVITLPESNEVLYEKRVPTSLALHVVNLAKRLGVTTVIARDGLTIVEQLNRDTEYMLTFGDPYPVIVPDLCEAMETAPTHVMVIAYSKKDQFDAIEEVFIRELGSELNIHRSSPYYLEILHREASKGNALQQVASYLGITRNAILAIGDSSNDISMLKFAGYAVAMGHSNDEVKRSADELTGTCDQDGFAEAIEKILSPLLE